MTPYLGSHHSIERALRQAALRQLAELMPKSGHVHPGLDHTDVWRVRHGTAGWPTVVKVARALGLTVVVGFQARME